MDLSLYDLRLLATIAELGSFRAAAASLELPPSTLSRKVSALERRLGLRVFNRTSRSLAPTGPGQAFIDRIAPALKVIQEAAESAATQNEEPCGVLRLNGSEPAFKMLMPTIRDFTSRYPDVQLDLVSDGLLSDIVAGGFDAGLRLAEAVPLDMIAVPVGADQRFVVVGSPEYIGRCGVPRVPGDLHTHDCIRARLPSGRILPWEFSGPGGPVTVAVSGRILLGSSELAAEAALEGLGLAYVTEMAVLAHVAAGQLVEVMGDWCPAFPGVQLYYPRHKVRSATLTAFVDSLRRRRRSLERNTDTPSPTVPSSAD